MKAVGNFFVSAGFPHKIQSMAEGHGIKIYMSLIDGDPFFSGKVKLFFITVRSWLFVNQPFSFLLLSIFILASDGHFLVPQKHQDK